MFNSVAESMDGIEGGATGHAMSKGLTTHAVLLVGIGKGYICPLLHIMQCAVTGGDVLDEGTTEGGVGEPERLAAAVVSSRGEGILSRSA